MKTQDFKHVVGSLKAGEPAILRLFGYIDSYAADEFVRELVWIQEWGDASEIVILINSEGGSVIAGMSIFSAIKGCPLKTTCIIEGIAASMGSVVWAAGDRLLLHDYSLLMIHNPVLMNCKKDATAKETLKAFRSQLEMVYMQQFNMSREDVRAMMDGTGDSTMTWLTADMIVEKGIVPAECVIQTPNRIHEKAAAAIALDSPAETVRASLDEVLLEPLTAPELVENALTIINKKEYDKPIVSTMNEKELTFDAICAILGLGKDAAPASVSPRVAELMKGEESLKEVQASLSELNIKYQGKEAELANVTAELAKAKEALNAYKAAEEETRKNLIASMIEDAVKEGRITAEGSESWKAMAETNMELVKATLAAIPPRAKITEEIAKDPKNIQDAVDATVGELAEKVKAVVGEGFKFTSF